MRAARRTGMSTATIGKLGPALIFDHTDRSGNGTCRYDTTGRKGGIPLSAEVRDRLPGAGVPLETPTRGDNAKSGDFLTPGTLQANVAQQDYFVNVTT